MLQVNNIDLFYGASQALRGVSLTANLGEVTCVLGRNGVGKTSLLRAIVGQQAIQSGAINWEDKNIAKLPSHALQLQVLDFPNHLQQTLYHDHYDLFL